MAFTDPQTITISGTAIVLPRVSTGQNKADYTSADGLNALRVSSAYGRRTRRVLRFDNSKITADPFIPAQNQKVSASIYIVVDSPVAGYTNADLKALYTGFNTLYSASSGALIDKLLGGES